MSDSIKRQIAARLLAIAQPLKTSDFGFRLVERKSTPFLLEPTKPAIHLIILPETPIDQDERGYTIEFHALYKIIVDDARDPYDLCDRAAGYLQNQIESDGSNPMQLGGLVSKLEYAGDQPFTEEALKPDGGNAVTYLINYRRMRGDPYTLY